MFVTNLRDVSDKPCRCGSWLEHWAKFGGCTTLAICSANGCCKIARVGSHVSVNGKPLIIPMCERHHQQSYPLDVYDHTLGVSADELKTCARPSLADLGLSSLSNLPMHRFQAPAGVASSLAGHGAESDAAPTEGEEIAAFLSGPIDRSKRTFGY